MDEDDEQVIKEDWTSQDSEENKYLLRVEKIDQDYVLRALKNEKKSGKANYLVVRSLMNKDYKEVGYIIRAGDVIRLGQVEYQISEMRFMDPSTKELKTDKFYDMLYQEDKYTEYKIADVTEQVDEILEKRRIRDETLKENEEGWEELACRYCLSESICSDQMDDMLICPCECKGGSSYVHVLCLSSWIKQKIVAQDSMGIKTYKWDNLKCEICKAKWPIIVKYHDQSKRLFKIEKPEDPYMIIEQISINKENKVNNNIISLITGKEGLNLTVGKDSKNIFRLTDPSISDSHATIKWEKGRFVLYDKKSKFGTLVRLSEDWKIGYGKVAVQTEKTVFTIMKKQTKNYLKYFGDDE
jgi:pSer/pThr/pTyr-binding forkhead associated (FHA) protein